MKQLVFHAPWEIGLRDAAATRELSESEVRVRVMATGICGTDLGIVAGQYHAKSGVVIGHESAGEVVAVGSGVRSVSVGTRVVIDPTYFCGWCSMCRTDRPNHCLQKSARESGVSCDGTFAPYYVTDEPFVHAIPDHMSYEQASLTEPLSCALTGLDQIRVRADMDTIVVGGGPMGLVYAHALAARGVVGTVVERAAGRLALCEGAVPKGWVARPPEEGESDSLDLIVDTSGRALPMAMERLRRGGQLLVVGLTSDSYPLSPALLADKSLSIVGSIDSIGTFGLASRMICSGVVPTELLISHRLELEQYREGMGLLGLDLDRRCRTGDISALKVILTP